MGRRLNAPPVSRTAGGAIKGTPQGNRRYIPPNPISAISNLTFLIFFKMILPYVEFITRLGLFSKKWDYTPPCSPPWGLHPPCTPWETTPMRAIFSQFFRYEKNCFFSKSCTKGFISPLGPKKIEIFSELFFSRPTPPCSPPMGDYTPLQSPGGLHPLYSPHLGDYTPRRAKKNFL